MTERRTSADGLDDEARRRVREASRAAKSSFYWSMRLLPKPRRDAMFAIYAFCRLVDDIADGDADAETKRRDLAGWREAVDRTLAPGPPPAAPGPADAPLLRALRWAAGAYGLAPEHFRQVVEGMEMDVAGAMRAPDWRTLDLYARRVAGAVGLLSIRVFGDARPEAERFALALGAAMQLTNILRDLREDAGRGRLYLPAEELDAHVIAARTPEAVLAHPRLGAACRGVAKVARDRFAEADRLLAACDRRALRPAAAMMTVYRRLLDRLAAGGWRDLDGPAELGRWEALRILLRHGLPGPARRTP